MTQATDLARQENGASGLARPDDVGGYRPMKPLDVYAKGIADEEPRVDYIATVSCGRLVDDRPRAARKSDPQWIYIHDENDMAQGLTQALIEGEGRRLTVAFPWDEPASFIHQSFRTYTKSSLKAYGDENAMTEIVVTGSGDSERAVHVKHMAGTDDYDRLVAGAKANFSVFFALARWTDHGPQVYFPDGAGKYRLRFTSRNTIRNILATLDETARMTNGRIAGIPFDLFVDFRQVARPNGKKQDIPVFSIRLRPPFELTSDTWRSTATAALKAGSMLQLPPPERETLESAIMDGPVFDDTVTDEDIDRLGRGGRCDWRHYIKLWHAMVRDTSLADAQARHEFIADYSDGIGSLSFFMRESSESEAMGLIVAAQDCLIARGELALCGAEEDDGADTSLHATHTTPPLPPDEYERTYGAAYADQEPIETEAREVAPPEAPDDEMHERLEKLGESLDETINQARSEAEDDPEELAKAITAYQKLQEQGTRYGATVPDLANGATLAEITEQGAEQKGLVLEAKANYDAKRKESTPIGT